MSKDCLTHAIENAADIMTNPMQCRFCRHYDAKNNDEPDTTGWVGSGRCKYHPAMLRDGSNRGHWPAIDGDEKACSKYIRNWE